MGKRKPMDTMSDAGFTQIFDCSQGVKWSLMFIEVFSYIRLRVFANQRYECRVAFPGVFLRIVAGYRLGFQQRIATKNSN